MMGGWEEVRKIGGGVGGWVGGEIGSWVWDRIGCVVGSVLGR